MTTHIPTGTVTFLFTDIAGSTRLVQRLGDRYSDVLEQHQRILRDAFARADGTVIGTEGDSFFVVFPGARQALAAAVDAQLGLARYAWPADAAVRVRMGLHTGEGTLGGGSYVGVDVHRAARVSAAGHGGQVLVSEATRSLVEEALPHGVRLRDLGEHRLKDLLRPERLYQVVHPDLESEFPPLATLTHRPNNLPTQTSEFLGRERELRSLRELLDDDAVRLVTLTGPGGIGKTRLALQAAAEQTDRFTDGLFFVDLSAARDPEVALEAIARAIGITGAGGQRPLELLQHELASRQLLLLLDNFEQVMAAVDPVAELLRRCPGLKVLVTSREALRLRGEHLFPVPPLGVPADDAAERSAEALAAYEAVRLFVERAQEAQAGFAMTDENAVAVAEICTRLDGLPLAIELAAARLRLFSPGDLRDRLRGRLDVLRGGSRDLPARQQTLRSTIEWSYELLDQEERAVFRLLSVFSSASVAVVEEVAGRVEPLRDIDVVERLASLVDKSLVRSVGMDGSQRLSMFETIREFAGERLAEQPEAAASAARAHGEFFSEFAASQREALQGPHAATTLEAIETEVANLLAAWAYWVRVGDLERLDQLLDALWALHDARGWYRGAVDLARDLLGVLSRFPSTAERATETIALATTLARGLLAIRGYTEEVDQAYGRVLALLEEAGDLPKLYPVLRSLASLQLFRAEFDKAAEVGRRLLQLGEEQRDPAVQVEAHLVLGANLPSLGDNWAGVEHLERAIALFDPERHGPARFRFGPNPGVVARTTLAIYRWFLGYPDRALDLASGALELGTKLEHPFSLAYAQFHVGVVNLWGRNFVSAHDRATAAGAIAEEHGYDVWGALALILQGAALAHTGDAEEALKRSDRGMALYQGLSTPPVFWPMLLSLRARTFAAAGRAAEGLEAIDQAIAVFGDQPTILYPQLPVIKGDLLLASAGPDAAEPLFRHAFEVGTRVHARMSQLHAAVRLARASMNGPQRPNGRELLRRVYQAFDEGFEIPDLVEARALLDEGR